MSDVICSNSSRLEELPDEILLEIFKYMKPIDLHSFIGHNLRINNVIQDVRLNIAMGCEDEGEDFDYLTSFLPNQFIRLELRCKWEKFDINVFKELRSLILDCLCLSENQLDQILTVNLRYLERFFIVNAYWHCEELLFTMLSAEHFPSLKICKFLGHLFYMLEPNDHCQLPNNTIRTLILDTWEGSQLNSLLNLLPNLHRFETSFQVPINRLLTYSMPHMSLAHLRVVLDDPANDLEKLLQYMPNIKVLSVTGMIDEDSALEHFEKLARIIRTYTPNLQRFHCELFLRTWNTQDDIFVIQQLHSLFKMIQCHRSHSNRCYATYP